MINFNDALIAYLSGIVTYKNEKEFWWVDARGNKVTVEFIDIEKQTYKERTYQNNTLRYEYSYVSLLQHGVCCDHDVSGRLMEETNFYGGKKCGWSKRYHTNCGKMCSKYFFKNGHRSGKAYTYDELGNLVTDGNYLNGVLHGTYKEFNIDGSVKRESNFKNGKIIKPKPKETK